MPVGYLRDRAECVVDGFRIRKMASDIWVKENQIGSRFGTFEALAAHTASELRQVVFGAQLVPRYFTGLASSRAVPSAWLCGH